MRLEDVTTAEDYCDLEELLNNAMTEARTRLAVFSGEKPGGGRRESPFKLTQILAELTPYQWTYTDGWLPDAPPPTTERMMLTLAMAALGMSTEALGVRLGFVLGQAFSQLPAEEKEKVLRPHDEGDALSGLDALREARRLAGGD